MTTAMQKAKRIRIDQGRTTAQIFVNGKYTGTTWQFTERAYRGYDKSLTWALGRWFTSSMPRGHQGFDTCQECAEWMTAND